MDKVRKKYIEKLFLDIDHTTAYIPGIYAEAIAYENKIL